MPHPCFFSNRMQKLRIHWPDLAPRDPLALPSGTTNHSLHWREWRGRVLGPRVQRSVELKGSDEDGLAGQLTIKWLGEGTAWPRRVSNEDEGFFGTVHWKHSKPSPGWGRQLSPLEKECPSPGWCGSVHWVLACEPEGCWFDSQTRHKPGLYTRSPVGGLWEATSHWCFFPSLSPSLTLSKNNLKEKECSSKIQYTLR